MSKLEDLVLFESANSALAFREHAYAADETGLLLQDVLALANADVEGPRFLFIGVHDSVEGTRVLSGLSADAMARLKRTVPALLSRTVEPPFKIVIRALKVQQAKIGLVCLSECHNPPYLLARNVADLPAGIGWVRRGTRQHPLLRADLERMFANRLGGVGTPIDLRVSFAGNPPRDEIELPALVLEGLPSALAAQQLRKMLEAKESAKQILGRTETHLARLMHAQIFGMDRAYEKHSDESLRLLIDKTQHEYRAADEHYEFEIRAHKLDLVVRNLSGSAVESVTLRLKLPKIPGIDVAEQLFMPPGSASGTADAYPLVTSGVRTIDIQTELGNLAAGATTRAFREPPRLLIREPAAGKSLPIDYTLQARELREPLRDTLVIRIPELGEQAGAKRRAG